MIDDELPAWSHVGSDRVQAHGRRTGGRRARQPRAWRLGRIATIALLGVLLLTGGGLHEILARQAEELAVKRATAEIASSSAPGTISRTVADEVVAQQAPTISGATQPYPLNNVFDSDPQNVGTPPTLYDFENTGSNAQTPPSNNTFDTAPSVVGAQFANFNFASGSYSGWTTAGSDAPTIRTTGGPESYWARIPGTGSSITTSGTITVASTAQALVFDLGFFMSTATSSVTVSLLTSGGSVIRSRTYSCANCSEWREGTIDVISERGSTVKLKFQAMAGVIGVDRVQQKVVFSGMSPGEDTTATPRPKYDRRLDGGVPYGYLEQGYIASATFTVNANARFARVSLKGMSTSTETVDLEVVNGSNYATVAKGVRFSIISDGWADYFVPLTGITGSVRLRVNLVVGPIGVDNLAVQRQEMIGWTFVDSNGVDSGLALVPDDNGGSALSIRTNDVATSPVFTVDPPAQNIAMRYRMGGVYNRNWYLRYRPSESGSTYSERYTLAGSLNNQANLTLWKAGVGALSGKLARHEFDGPITLDDVGVMENLVPGWTTLNNAPLDVGENADGTYVTTWGPGGNQQVQLRSSRIDPGIVNRYSYGEYRYYVVGFSLRPQAAVQMTWRGYSATSSTTMGNSEQYDDDPNNSIPDDIDGAYQKMVRGLPESFVNTAEGGWLNVSLSGEAHVYSVGDNVAREQMAEQASQDVGSAIDTTTGNFTTSAIDAAMPGGQMPMVLGRYYAGHSARVRSLGFRWMHSFETALEITEENDVAVVFGSGEAEFFDYFYNPSIPGYRYRPSDGRNVSTLVKETTGHLTYTTPDKITYSFDADGTLNTIVDPDRFAITLTRSAVSGQGKRINAITDQAGRAYTLTYGTADPMRLTRVTDANGAQIDYTYDAAGDVTTVERKLDATFTARTEYTYSNHRLLTIKERQITNPATTPPGTGMITVQTNTLDAYNRVITQKDAANKTTQLAYATAPGDTATGGSPGVTRVTDERAGVGYYYHDRWARTTDIQPPAGGTVRFLYDVKGDLERWVDGSNGETVLSYNPSRRPLTVTDPLGRKTSYAYANGALPYLPTEEITDEGDATRLNLKTTHVYDQDGNRTQTVVDVGDATHRNYMTVWTYDSLGRMTSETVDPRYDAAGADRGASRLDLMIVWRYDDASGLPTAEIRDPAKDRLGNVRTGTHADYAVVWEHNARGNTTKQTIDPTVLLGVTRPGFHLNQVSTYTYDLAGRMSSRTRSSGTVFFGYDLQGHLRYYRDELTREVFWEYDQLGRLTKKKDPAGKSTTYAYDPAGNVETVTDPLGRITTYEYDGSNRPTKEIEDFGAGHLNLTTTATYDGEGRVKTLTDPTNRTVTYTYDTEGKLTEVLLPNAGVWTYRYDGADRVLEVEDPLQHVWAYEYTGANEVKKETDPTAHVTEHVYDTAGRRTEEWRRPGGSTILTTISVYDGMGRVTQTTDGSGVVSARTFTNFNTVATTTLDPGTAPHANATTTYGYDPLGRLQTISDPLNRVTTYGYDLVGHQTSVDVAGRTTSFTFDSRDRLTDVKLDPAGQNLWTRHTYDDAGQVLTTTNPRDKVTSYEYDLGGRMTMITDAGAASGIGVVQLAYDGADRLTGVTNARGKTTAYEYDSLGNRNKITLPATTTTNVWTFEYDLAGRQTKRTDANGLATNYAYDNANRLTSEKGPGGAPAYASYGYDLAGRRTQMVDPLGTTNWSFDGADRVTGASSPQGNATYTHDTAGRRKTMVLPGSKTITYGYDAASQVTSIADWNNATTTYSYTNQGEVSGISRPNNVLTMQTYDTAGRLDIVEHAQNATLLARYNYDVDKNGNRTQVAITGTHVANRTETYQYDNLDRLTNWGWTQGAQSGAATYAYDKNGNRATVADALGTSTYAYDDADRLTSITGANAATFAFDKNGNRTSGGGNTYTYDRDDRLLTATVGGTTTTIGYAGDGTRTSRKVGAGTTVTELWDREMGLGELVAESGGSTRQYVQSEAGVQSETGSATTYPLLDGLGTPRDEVNGAGASVGTADYDPWGNAWGTPTTAGALQWAGEVRDGAAGSTYLRARSYDPLRGQFQHRDTVSPNGPGTQGYASYAYAGNGPVTHTDPSGRCVGCGGGMLALQAYQMQLAARAPAEVGRGATMAQRTLWVVSAFALVAAILYCAITPQCRDLGLPGWGDVSPGVEDAALGVADRAYSAAAGAMAAVAAVVPDFPNLNQVLNDLRLAVLTLTAVGAATVYNRLTCQGTAAFFGWRLTSEGRAHIEQRHSPDADYIADDPNGRFNWRTYAALDFYIGLAIVAAPLPFVQFNGKCNFTLPVIGHSTGVDSWGTHTTYGLTVIYEPRSGQRRAFEVITAYPV